MQRRVNLPGADELFRSTAKNPDEDDASEDGRPKRAKHDEKMTVYITAAELLAVEQARLTLRAELSRTVDRGRFVRAAIALALEDLDARGIESDVARRLSGS